MSYESTSAQVGPGGGVNAPPLALRSIQERLDRLVERRLAGLTDAEQVEYFELIRLELAALRERDARGKSQPRLATSVS